MTKEKPSIKNIRSGIWIPKALVQDLKNILIVKVGDQHVALPSKFFKYDEVTKGYEGNLPPSLELQSKKVKSQLIKASQISMFFSIKKKPKKVNHEK